MAIIHGKQVGLDGRNVCLRRYRLTGLVTTLTSDLDLANLISSYPNGSRLINICVSFGSTPFSALQDVEFTRFLS